MTNKILFATWIPAENVYLLALTKTKKKTLPNEVRMTKKNPFQMAKIITFPYDFFFQFQILP